VIIKGRGRLYERVLPYSLAKYGQLDLEYYEEQQILPAAIRVLSLFGKKDDDLKPRYSPDLSKGFGLGSEKQVRLV
jgi:DNA polymerase elongation subunit (family B)